LNCLGCGYRIGEVSEHRCPECGRNFDPADDRTFDAGGRRLRAGKRCLWVAAGCIAYVLLFAGSMIGAVAARLVENASLMDVAHLIFSIAACCTPIVFVVHMSMMIAAPLAAGYAREHLWTRWWSTLLFSLTAWCGAAGLLMVLLSALMI
jgi:cytochrome b subunit of formate dehydrogenase